MAQRPRALSRVLVRAIAAARRRAVPAPRSWRSAAAALVAAILTAALMPLYGCSGGDPFSEKNFVGKWKSSKLETPIYLHANGEWEVKTDEGAVLQFGVWRYKDKTLLWSYKIDGQVGHDPNAVLSASAREFQLRERDRTTTTFVKLD